MSIFRETELSWKGQKYTLVPSMRLLHSIEAGDPSKGIGRISLASVALDAATAQPQVAKMSHIVEVVMRHAGAQEFTEDEFYSEMSVGDRAAAVECWQNIIDAISPRPKQGKEAAAQSQE